MLAYIRMRRHFILFGILLLMAFAVPVVARLSVDTVFRPQLSEQNSELYNNIPKILSDLETLDQNPIFSESRYERNAEVLLSRYISMEGVEVKMVLNPRYDSLQRISGKEYRLWRTDEDQFQKLLSDKELMAIDTNWMQSLSNYDHWNYSYNKEIISSLTAVRDVNALTRLEIFSQLPVPDFQQLRSWAIINFIKLFKQGRGLEGLKTYRQVTNLLHSSGNLVASMTAASMLKDEYLLLSKFFVRGWEPVPIYYIEVYSRVTWAWMAILQIPYFNDFPQSLIPYLKPQDGICAGALGAVSNFSLYRDFFEPQTFFEANFTANVSYTKNLFKKIERDCNLSVYDKFFDRSPASLNPFSSYTLDEEISERKRNTDYNFSLTDNWIYVPYVRRLVGMVYFANGSPINYVMPYQTRKKKSSGRLNLTNGTY